MAALAAKERGNQAFGAKDYAKSYEVCACVCVCVCWVCVCPVSECVRARACVTTPSHTRCVHVCMCVCVCWVCVCARVCARVSRE